MPPAGAVDGDVKVVPRRCLMCCIVTLASVHTLDHGVACFLNETYFERWLRRQIPVTKRLHLLVFNSIDNQQQINNVVRLSFHAAQT